MKATITPIEQQTSAQRTSRLSMPIVCAVVFAFTVLAHSLFHYASHEPNAFFAPDGPHYLASTQQLTEFMLSVLHGKPDMPLLFSRPSAEVLAFDGPIVPALPAMVFTILGHAPKATGWRIFVAINVLSLALCASVVALITDKLTSRRVSALIAGLAFGLSPWMIVASGRFCSEIPAAVLVLLFAFFLASARGSMWFALAAGVSGGLLAISKPAMVPAVGLALVWAVLNSSRKVLVAGVLAVSLALTLLPWGCYTKSTLGKFCITADRWPVYNATVGTDRETDGWTTLHQSDWSIFMSTCDSPGPIFISQWSTHPQEMTTLALRRVTRMWAQPWNNFRRSVYGLDVRSQQWLYLLLLQLSLFGIFVYFLSLRPTLLKQQKLLGDLCVILLGGHLGYLFFQAIARYALSAQSLLFVFAAVGLTACINAVNQKAFSMKTTLIAVICSALLLGFVVQADFLTRLDQAKETRYVLNGQDKIEKRITIPATKYLDSPNHALILLDGDAGLGHATIEVNGHRAPGPCLPLADYSTDAYSLYPSISEHTEYMRLSVDDLRQWRAVAVPISWINLPGDNIISVKGPQPFCVYGRSGPESRHMLSPRYFAHDQLLNSTCSLEPRIPSPITTSRSIQSSWISNNGGTLKQLPGSISIHLAIICDARAGSPSCDLPRRFYKELTPASFNEMLRDGDCIKINRFLAKYAPYTGAIVDVPRMAETSHLAVRMTGMYKTESPGGNLGVRVALSTGPEKETVLGRCPHYLPPSTQWKPFVIEDVIPRQILQGDVTRLSVFLLPYHWQQSWLGFGDEATESRVKDIHINLTSVDLPDPTFARTFYY